MSHNISLRLVLALLIAGVLLPLASVAQTQDSKTESVAEAARRSRAQKKAASKPLPVITNDDLKPAAPAQVAASTPASSSSFEAAPLPAAQAAQNSSNSPVSDNSSSSSADSSPGSKADDASQKSKDSAELAGLKRQLVDAQNDVDLLKRELSLDQDTVYSNPNYTDDPSGKAKLDALQQQIADKQQVVDGIKARIAALQNSAASVASPAPAAPPQP
jgi:hypothetical protein